MKAPLDYVPRELSSWHHRFDDPRREYRTLYCADEKLTCLREVLADLRPNAKALAEFASLFGDASLIPAGEISRAWRRQHALAPASIALVGGALVDLDDVPSRERLARRHARLLARHGMRHLDISEVRSRQRPVTQAISRTLYDEGAAGVRFRSNLDDRPCTALFEGRGRLEPAGTPIPLTRDLPELLQVCAEYSLTLRRGR
ncbi:MAG: RES domain-containing protein [Candidatus Rokubacteria bacterium]|nr:RES domain-containing protein [Candidatus Rokubacteria bacterium]